MNAEITDKDARAGRIGQVFYDAACPLCAAWATRWEASLAARGFGISPLQSAAADSLKLAPEKLLREMRVRTTGGHVCGGADAIVLLASHHGWAMPLVWFASLPGGRAALRLGYRALAANRRCAEGVCGLRTKPAGAWWDWLPVFALPAAAVIVCWDRPAWLLMWAVALGLFIGFKWLTWHRAQGRGIGWRDVGYLFGWVGLDAPTFLKPSRRPAIPPAKAVVFAFVKLALGLACLAGAVRLLPIGGSPLAIVWLGMVGTIFALHFGAFHLLALAWQRAGVLAEPIMRNPLAATSLAEFWGVRWNRGFSDLAREHWFKPVAARHGAVAGMLVVFLLSSLLHEAVLSLPARGGWGGPMAYFLTQAVALLLERSAAGKHIGLGRGWPGWLFVALTTLAPIGWLLHEPFQNRVMLPFIEFLAGLVNFTHPLPL